MARYGPMSAEHKAKISAALKGRMPKNHAEALAKAHATPKPTGEDHPSWLGDEVGYTGVHLWVVKVLGKPNKCEHCESETEKRYEWHNRSGEYKRDVTDWIRLCSSCHKKEGFRTGELTIWNKGLKTGLVPKTAIQPGQHLSPRTQFQKGRVAHNKYLEQRPCQTCSKPFQPLDATRKFCCRRCYWDSLMVKT